MFRWMLRPLGLIRRRPFVSVGILLLVSLMAVPAAVHVWALSSYRQAEQELDDDRLADAHAHIGFCLAVWPWSARTHLLAARVARKGDALSEAEAQLDECRRLDHGATEDTQLEMLLLRAQRGEVDQVIEGLVYAAEHDKAHRRDILESLAWGYLKLVRLLPALNLLNRCLTDYPDDIRALDWRGWVLERLDQQEKAAADYEHALKLQPDRVMVRLRLAQVYLARNDPVEAEQHLRQLEKLQPGRPEVELALGQCRFFQGKEDAARQLLDQALAARPDDATALLYRGKLELQAGRPEEAEGYFRKCLRADPQYPEALSALFDSLRGRPGHEKEADAVQDQYRRVLADGQRMQELLDGEVEKASDEPGPPTELGKLYLDAGQDELALYWLNTALKRDPHHKPTHAALAAYFEKKGDKAAADEQRRLAD